VSLLKNLSPLGMSLQLLIELDAKRKCFRLRALLLTVPEYLLAGGRGVVSGEYCETTSGYIDREEGKASSNSVHTTPEMPQTAEISST